MTVNMILDVAECPIERPLDNETQRQYYSGKKKRHTIKYEIAVQLVTGRIVWMAGGVPGSTHDLDIARNCGLIEQLLAGEKILADKAYVAEECFIHPFKGAETEEERVFNSAVSSLREIVEHSIGRIKLFHFTKQAWRHELSLHLIAFKVVCHALNVELEFYPVHQ
jgi:hypothetical protein